MSERNITIFIRGDASQLSSTLSQVSTQLNQFNKSTGSASGGAKNVASSTQQLTQSMNQFSQGSGVAIDRMGRNNAAMHTWHRLAQAMRSESTMLGKAWAVVGTYAKNTAGIFAGFIAVNTTIRMVTNAVEFAVSSFVDFNAAMTESTAIMGKLGDETKKSLENGVIASIQGTKYSAAEAAQALYYIASAGFDANSSIAVLPETLKFAQAGLIDTGKAAEYLMDVTAAMRLVVRDSFSGLIDVEATKKNMEMVGDVITKASIDSNATIEQISQALTGRAAAQAQAANMDVQQLTAVVETYAMVGIKGAAASTQIAMAIRDMQRAAIKAPDAFKALNIEVFKADGSMNNFGDIINQMSGAMANASVEQRRMMLQMLGFQDRSSGAILAIAGLGGAMKAFEASNRAAGGTMDQVAANQMESFKNKFIALKNQIGVGAIKMGEAFVEVAKNIGNVLAPLGEEILKFAEGAGGAIVNFAKGFFGVFGGAGAAIGKPLISGLTGILSVINALKPAVLVLSAVAIRSFLNWSASALMNEKRTESLTAKYTALTQKAREYQAVSQMAQQAKGNPNAEGTVLGGMARTLQAEGAGMLSRAKGFATRIGDSFRSAWRSLQVGAGNIQFGGKVEKESQKGVGALKRFENGVAKAGSGVKSAFSAIGTAAEVTSLAATVALTQIMASQSEAESKAKDMASAIGGGIDTTKFSGAVERYNLLVSATNEKTDQFNKTLGDSKSWERAGKMANYLWEQIAPGENIYTDLFKQQEALTEETKKQFIPIQNTEQAFGKLQDRFQQSGQSATVFKDRIHQVMQQFGLDKIENLQLSDEMMKKIQATMDLNAEKAKYFATQQQQATLSSEELDSVVQKQTDSIKKGYESILDPVDAYTSSLYKALDAQSLFNDYIGELTDQRDAQYDAMKKASEASAKASADAQNKATQSAIESQSDAIDKKAKEEIDALERGRRDTTQEYKDSLDTNQKLSADEKDQVRIQGREYSDAQKDATDQKIESIRDNAERQKKTLKDNAKEVQAAEQEFAKPKVEYSLQGVIDFYQKSLDQTEYIRSSIAKISEMKLPSGPATSLVDFLKGLKPDQAKEMLDKINNTTLEEVDKLNATLQKIGEVPPVDINEVMGRLEKQKKTMTDYMSNLAIVTKASAGRLNKDSFINLSNIYKKDMPQIMAALADEIKNGNFNIVNQFIETALEYSDENMNNKANELMQFFANYSEQLNTGIGKAFDPVKQEELVKQMQNLHLDEKVILQLSSMAMSTADQAKVAMMKTVDEYMLYLEKMKFKQAHPEVPQEQIDEAYKWSNSLGGMGMANGGITFFANGGQESHIAQMAKPGEWRVWAEPETGGEAYIPLAESKRGRSVQILSEVAKMFGFTIQKYANGQAMFGNFKQRRPITDRYSTPGTQAMLVPSARMFPASPAPSEGNIFKTENNWNFGDVHGPTMEDVQRFAERKKRQRNIVGG